MNSKFSMQINGVWMYVVIGKWASVALTFELTVSAYALAKPQNIFFPLSMKWMLSSLLLLFTSVTSAQSNINRLVVDQQSNQPIEYAHVFIKGKFSGTVTNSDGSFNLGISDASEDDTVVVSHIKYVPYSVTVSQLRALKGNISLSETTWKLDAVTVVSNEDDGQLLEILKTTKAGIRLPSASSFYYREWIKENKEFNRFSDGLIHVQYAEQSDDSKFAVLQSRAFKLPKEDDELFEIASPIKISYLLNLQYGTFLNRFTSPEKKSLYHFYATTDEKSNETIVIIEPRREAKTKKDELLYHAIIAADANGLLTEAEIVMDSLTSYDKSILGVKMKAISNKLSLRFIQRDGVTYLSYARLSFTLRFNFRGKIQIGNYTSEMLLTSSTSTFEPLKKERIYKKNSLFPNGNKFTTRYWEELNVPMSTADERRLLEKLQTAH